MYSNTVLSLNYQAYEFKGLIELNSCVTNS